MLQINYSKTKVLVFAQRPRIYKWLIDEHEIEQIKAYKYLGVVSNIKETTRPMLTMWYKQHKNLALLY